MVNFDIYKILNDWGSNFTTGNRESNPYITKDKDKDLNINVLDIQKLMDDVSSKKQLIPSKANDFLRALGIVLDTGSAEIKNVIENKNKRFIASYNIEQIYASKRRRRRTAARGRRSVRPSARLTPLAGLAIMAPEPARRAV